MNGNETHFVFLGFFLQAMQLLACAAAFSFRRGLCALCILDLSVETRHLRIELLGLRRRSKAAETTE